MQEETYGFNFEEMSIRDVMNFWHTNTHALIDEIHEMTDALGGIKDGSGNAVWKYWKNDYHKYQDMKVSDLSENDKKELFMEWVDILHFFMNYAASIGMTSQEMYNMYMSKNEENRRRQANNY